VVQQNGLCDTVLLSKLNVKMMLHLLTPFQSLNFFLWNANRPANLYDLELSAFNPVVDRAKRNFKDPANVFFGFQFITSIDYNYTLLYVNCQQFSTKNPPVFIPAGLVVNLEILSCTSSRI